jgi:hypothetical membrane protein
MITAIIIILGAFLWLLMETNWLTIRLPTYKIDPLIDLPNLRKISWILNTHGILALAGIVGPLILVTMDLIAAFTQPKYSPIRQSISSLALTSMGWIQTIGFMLIGLMIESFTAGLYLNIKRRRGFGFGTTLLAFFGFGMLVLGTFHTRAVGAPATFSSRVHAVAADSVLGLFPVALTLMLTSIKNDKRWRRMFNYTVVTAIIAVALAACYPFLPKGFQFFGLYERLMVLNAITWLGTFAVRLLILSFRRREA